MTPKNIAFFLPIILIACKEQPNLLNKSEKTAINSSSPWFKDTVNRIYIGVDRFQYLNRLGSSPNVIGCVGESKDPAAETSYLSPNGGIKKIKLNERVFTYEFDPVAPGHKAKKPGECEVLWGPTAANLPSDMFDVVADQNMIEKAITSFLGCSGLMLTIATSWNISKVDVGALPKTLYEKIFGWLAQNSGTKARSLTILGLTAVGMFGWCTYHMVTGHEMRKANILKQRAREFLAFYGAAESRVEQFERSPAGNPDYVTTLKEQAGQSDYGLLEERNYFFPKIAAWFNQATAEDWKKITDPEFKMVNQRLFERGEFFQEGPFSFIPFLTGGTDQTFEALRDANNKTYKTWTQELRSTAIWNPLKAVELNGDCEALAVKNYTIYKNGSLAPVFAEKELSTLIGAIPAGTKVYRYLTAETKTRMFQVKQVILETDVYAQKEGGGTTKLTKGSKLWIHPLHLVRRPHEKCIIDQ